MGIDAADIWRLLPMALGSADFRREGNRVGLAMAGGRLQLDIEPAAPRRIASMTIPVTRVSLQFQGVAPEVARAFLLRFERSYQAGGG